MKNYALLSVSIVMLLSGCGKGVNSYVSMDQDGNCSASFVSEYNSIVSEGKHLQSLIENKLATDSLISLQIKTLDSACDQFLYHHGHASCVAEVDHSAKQVSASDHVASCAKVKNSLLQMKTSSPAPVEPPPQVIGSLSDSLLMSSIGKSDLKLAIQDAAAVKRILKDQDLVMVNGRVGRVDDFQNEIRVDATICFFGSTKIEDWSARLANSAELASIEKVESTHYNGHRRLMIAFDDGTFSLGCTRVSGKEFTLREVRMAIFGIAQLPLSKPMMY